MENRSVTSFTINRELRPALLRSAFIWAAAVGVAIFFARASAHLGMATQVHDLAVAFLAVGTLFFGSVMGWRRQWGQMIFTPLFGCFAFFLAVIAGEMVIHGPIAGFFWGLLKGFFEGLVMYFVFLSLFGLGGLVGFGGRLLFHHDATIDHH